MTSEVKKESQALDEKGLEKDRPTDPNRYSELLAKMTMHALAGLLAHSSTPNEDPGRVGRQAVTFAEAAVDALMPKIC